MTRIFCLLLALMVLLPTAGAYSQSPAESEGGEAQSKGQNQPSGLPLPRYASLKSDNVYVRTGPSMDYPIKWIYKREGLPVEILQEFDAWRKIKDPDGNVGWAHKILLSGKKMAIIRTDAPADAYNNTEMEKAVVQFEKGVIVNVSECQKLVCRVHFAPYEGWIEKKHLWGVYGSDIFN